MMRVPLLPRPLRSQAWLFFFLTWSLASLSVLVPSSLVNAQDEAQPPDAAAPAELPADPAAEEPLASGVGETALNEEAPRASMLAYLMKAHSDPLAAFVGLVLLGISVYFVALVIRLFLEYRVSEAAPPALIEKLETLIKERKFQDAYDVCRDDNSVLSRLVRTGIANLPAGRAEAKEAMSTLSEEIVVTMESRISYLATIGTLGPMIGLVGTVWGMIRSFQEIAMAAGTQPRADQVASGISTALFITLEGISIAVPAIFFFAYFRNRIAQIAMETTRIADRTIAAFWTAAKQPNTQPVTQTGASQPTKP